MKKQITIFVILISIIFCYNIHAVNYHPDLSEEEYVKILHETLKIVKDNYVDTDKIKLEDLYYGAINGMITSLDDVYTRFLPAAKYDDMKSKTTGQFGGLGIVITVKDDMLTVISPIYGTPAFEKGIEPGDKIIAIEGKSTKDLSLTDAVGKLRGKPKTPVKLTIYREFNDKKFDVTIVRDIIKIESIHSTMLKDSIGYVRIAEFSETTREDMEAAINKLKSEGMQKLIIDLRNNPGGLLTTAYEVADMFLDEGMVVYTRGRDPRQNKNFYARNNNYDVTTPLIILCNGGSASGSEIVIGALKDNKRALIIGTKSFGKGSVQTVFNLKRVPEANAAIAVTTAYYYTPSGVCIHKKGIEPHIKVEQKTLSEHEAEMFVKLYKGEYALKFIHDKPNYTEEDFKEFMDKLKKDKITLSPAIIKNRIKQELARKNGKQVVVDVDTDEQLKYAIKMFKAFDVFANIK